MAHTTHMKLRGSLGGLALWLLLAQHGFLIGSATASTLPCPDGSTPREHVELAAFVLPSEASIGAQVVLTRITLGPGEELQPEVTGYSAYFVESGTLKVQLLPRGQGFHLEPAVQCEPASGVFSGGGSLTIDDEGWMLVNAGTALIPDERPIERMANAGNDSLVLLQVALVFPEIDPATGQPLGDELVTDRGNRDRQEERRERRNATPTP